MSKILKEMTIELALVSRAKHMGYVCYKLDKIPGARNNPDQVLINNKRECVFVEVKRKDLEPRPAQVAEHKILRSKGQKVHILDDVNHIDSLLKKYWR